MCVCVLSDPSGLGGGGTVVRVCWSQQRWGPSPVLPQETSAVTQLGVREGPFLVPMSRGPESFSHH